MALHLETGLSRVDELLRDIGLSISPEKSFYSIFSSASLGNMRRMLDAQRIGIALRDVDLALSWRTKYLGLTIDYDLSWRGHVADTVRRAQLRLNILKAMAGIRWGSHPSILLTVYRGFIRSVLEWGCQIFLPLRKPDLERISRVQYACIRAILGLMRTTPTNVLMDISGELPLELRWRFLAERFVCKIIARPNHPLNQSVRQDINHDCLLRELPGVFGAFGRLKNLVPQIERFEAPGHLAFQRDVRLFECATDLDSGRAFRACRDPQEAFAEYCDGEDFHFVLYTDGSRSSEDGSARVGYGVYGVRPREERSRRINNHANIFDAESAGVLAALDVFSDLPSASRALVATDSMSVVSCLGGGGDHKGSHHPNIYRIKTRTELLFRERGIYIRFLWIPSHRGILRNERADELAKMALELPDPSAEERCFFGSFSATFKDNARREARARLVADCATKGHRYFRLRGGSILSPLGSLPLGASFPDTWFALSRVLGRITSASGRTWQIRISWIPLTANAV